jgi:hypothetical protein
MVTHTLKKKESAMCNAKAVIRLMAVTGLLALSFAPWVLAKKGGVPPGHAKKQGSQLGPVRGLENPRHGPPPGKLKPRHGGPPGKAGPAYRSGPSPWAPAHGRRARYTYRYYPGLRVYFDTVKAHYFWFSSGTWLSGSTLPPGLVLPETGFVTLGMDVRDPFQFDDEVSVFYPGNGHGPPPWAPAHGRRAKYTYQYYPGLQVYFDPVRAHYFWFSSGTWLSGPELPPELVLPETGFVTLGMDVREPFQFHGEVVLRFPFPHP